MAFWDTQFRERRVGMHYLEPSGTAKEFPLACREFGFAVLSYAILLVN